ncbi:unnamed protein product, partial [Rotaria sp. Silwood1]
MKLIFLLYYLIVHITIIYASNQYLGCFIDQIGNRDLNLFIGDYERLTPKQCILICQERNFPYAGIQHGNECRCGRQYGKHGQVSDDECIYNCSTLEKCGGHYRNSIYNTFNSIDSISTGYTCQNNLIGYQGCFDSITLNIGMDIVYSIEQCIQRCSIKYAYAGIMNGNLCHCGNDLNQPSLNSNLCHIRCNKSSNDMAIDCCGGLHMLSVYNIKIYLVNESTYSSLQTTAASSTLPSITSISLYTVSVTAITSQSSITTSSSLLISSLLNSAITNSSSTYTSQPISFTPSSMNNIYTSISSSLMMSNVTSTIPISSTNIVTTLITTSHVNTSTSTLVVINTISNMSQSSTNPINTAMRSSESNSISSVQSNIGTVVSTSSVTRANQTSSYTDTTISPTPLSSISFNSSITNTTINLSTASQLISTISIPLSQTSTIPISLNSTPSSTVVSSSSSNFTSIMTTESLSTSPLISTQSSQITMMTVSQQNNSEASISNASILFTNSLASSSTNVGIQTTINSSLHTDVTTQITLSTESTVTSTVMITSASNLSTITTASQTVNSTLSTTTISTSRRTTIAASSSISTIIIVPFNQNFTPTDNNTQQSIRQGLIRVINFGFNCRANSSYPNCTQSRLRVKRQICSNGYDVNLLSDITEISNSTSRKYMVDYSVIDLCNSGILLSPIQVKIATDALSREQIINTLGYDIDGALIRSTTIDSRQTQETDRKLWLIGATLGPVAFVLLLIFVFCYLHYKCRPRPTNRPLAKPVYSVPPVSARSTVQKPTSEKTIHALTQNDPLVGASASSRRLTPSESEKSSTHTPRHPVSVEIPLDEIRHQNDVERWRNKIRLQEKFQQSPVKLPDSSVP